METIGTDVAKSTLGKLVDEAIAQSRYICCFTCITEDFENEKETLKAKRETVVEDVKVANGRDEIIPGDVIHWQKHADNLIKEDTKTKATCFFGWCPNCKWRYTRGKDLANKTEYIKRLLQESNNFRNGVGIPRAVAGVEYYSSQDYISFKSRDLKYKELLEALTNDNNYITGLRGMGGTGKTTLAIEVGKELKESKKFDTVIDTLVSYAPDIKKIQDDIAGPLGLSLKDYTESDRPKRLRSRLTNGEKILIILDNVWDVNSVKDTGILKDIGIPYKGNHNGCRILITTRDLRTCNSMRCDRIIKLELLPEKDAWMLFKKCAGLSDSSPQSILDEAGKMTKECKGLPIAIAVIASSLRGEQRLEEWNVALESLQNFKPLNGDDKNLDEIYKCLRYSYDNMKNEKARRLFLLCSVFEEDEVIFDETLTRFSIGAGLVPEIFDSYDEGRKQVVAAKNKLIDSCLLLKTLKMHDLVRKVALLIANEEVKAVKTSDKKQKSLVEKAKNLKYLRCEGKSMDVFSLVFDRSKLEILIVRLYEEDSVEFPDSFFENMIGLRVLYLSHKSYQKTTLSLTQSIHSLTSLRSLFLERFALGDISILRNLQCLETLDLEYCLMDELPREIAELGKLKLLRLLYCEIRRNNPFVVIESCCSLEELYFKCSFPTFRSTELHQKVKLPKLRRFQIIDGFGIFSEERNSLSVSKLDGVFSETTFKHLMQTSDSVELNGLEGGWRNLIPDIILPEDDGTVNLAQLQLNSISELQCLIDEMGNLKEICSGPLTLYNLKDVTLMNCPMLVNLFPLSTLQSLVLLEILYIENCEQLKSITTDEKEKQEETVDGNDKNTAASLFPNLKTIYIERCPKLEFILPVVAGRDAANLEEIQIYDCVELKSIFGSYQHKQQEQNLHQEFKDQLQDCSLSSGILFKSNLALCNLKYVTLMNCPMVVTLFPLSTIQSLLLLEKLHIENCEQLKSITTYEKEEQEEIVDGNDNKSGASLFPNLKTLRIKRCPKLEFILPVVAGRDAANLEEIQIYDCVELKYIFGSYQHKQKQNLHQELKDAIFVTLKLMVLEGLPNLVDIFLEYDQYTSSSLKTSCSKDKDKTQIESTVKRSGSKDNDKTQTKSESIKCNMFPWIHKYRHKLRTAKYPLEFKDQLQDCSLQSIIDEDTKDERLSYLPRLQVLVIKECNNMKCVFPFSTSAMPPKLEVLVIKEASMLEEVFRCESDKKVEISNVKSAIFAELPSFCQGIDFRTVKYCWVQNCPKLSLMPISTPTLETIRQIILSSIKELNVYYSHEHTIEKILEAILKDLHEDFEVQEISNQNPTEVIEDFSIGTKVEAVSENGLTSSQVHTNQAMHSDIAEHNQHVNDIESNEFISTEKQTKETLEIEQEFVEIKLPGSETQSIAISLTNSELIGRPCRRPWELDIPLNETHSLYLKEIEDQSTQKGSMLEKNSIATLSTNPKMGKISSGSLVTQEVKRNVEEGNTSSVYGKTITSPVDSESEDYEGQVVTPSFSLVNIKPTTSKNVANEDIQQTSKSIIIHSEANAPENLSQIVEDSSIISNVTRELEQLVSNKYLALENLSLLIDFLVKNPSVRLTNNALSDRYKGFAYTCLVDLLKFLQTHSASDVLGSNHSEFVGLLQDVRTLGFDKNWLDSVERRSLFPVSPFSTDPLQNILHSKRTLIQHLEDMKHQLEEIIIQQETQLLEVNATLSTPLGY